MARSGAKTKVLRVRLTEAEDEGLRALCGNNGITLSDGVRRMVRASLHFGPVFDGEARAAVLDLAEQIRAAGVNFNQLVKLCHQGRMPDSQQFQQTFSAFAGALAAQQALYEDLCARPYLRMRAALTDDASAEADGMGAVSIESDMEKSALDLPGDGQDVIGPVS